MSIAPKDAAPRPAPGQRPGNVHSGVTEWFVDSHASGTEWVKDSIYEGEVYLNYISHPAQIAYRTILPRS